MRVVEVDAARLERWCGGFAERHGGTPTVAREPEALLLTGPDGATARLVPPFPWPGERADLPTLMAASRSPGRCAVVVVRRGGYACAVVDGDRVERSKVGTRYVQSRTAAGGWSQQRFARRRDNQAQALAQSAADVAARVLTADPAHPFAWLVTGGDVALVATVLADPRLRALAALPRGPHLALGDPRADVVRALPDLIRKVRIELRP